MNKLFLILLVVPLISEARTAGGSLSILESKIAKAKADETRLQNLMSGLQEQMSTAGCSREGVDINGIIGDRCPDGAKLDSKGFINLRAQIGTHNVDLEKVRADLRTWSEQKEAIADVLTAKDTAAKEVTDAYLKEIADFRKAVYLTSEWSALKVGALSLETRLNTMEEKFDSTATGIYLQDKIGKLLNSDVMCEVVNDKCGSAKRVVIGDDQMKEIFPNINSKNSRGGEAQRARTYDSAESIEKRKARGAK